MFSGALLHLIGLLTTVTLFSGGSTAPVHTMFNSTPLNNSIESLYSFKFDETNGYVSQLDSTNAMDLEVVQLIQLWWVGLTLGTNSSELLDLERHSARLLNKYSEPRTPQERFLKVLAGTFIIRLAGIKGNKTLALKTFIKISSELKLVLKEPTASQENMLIAGVYHYSVGGIKMNNYLLKPFLALLPPANSYEGKIYLIECTKSNYNVIRTEAYYFLYKIDYEIYRLKSEAISHIKWLVNQYPNNLIFRLEQIKISEISGKLTPNHREDFIIMVNESELTKKQKDHFISKIDKLLQ